MAFGIGISVLQDRHAARASGPPLPLGEGGVRGTLQDSAFPIATPVQRSPHPGPLPKGRGSCANRQFATTKDVLSLSRELRNARFAGCDDRSAGRPAAAAGGRFLYPSGSRPLEGYTIKRGVGQGGFGEIYFAASDAGKEVALKLIRRNLNVELRGIRQCLNLKHPNLLALYDIRRDDKGDTWVVMEYMSGRSLEEAIAAHPRGLPAAEALGWIRGIGAGVAYLHNHGIVHRDLKPGNIFSDEGMVKVGDYGLSKFVSCSRRSGHTESVGTVHYMAPEIANGRYGKEIDVYAMGVILYENAHRTGPLRRRERRRSVDEAPDGEAQRRNAP